MGEWGGVDTPYTVLTTRAPAVLKMSLFVFFTNVEPQGFGFPLQFNQHYIPKHVFVILVLDDHVLRKHGSRVYVVVVTVTLPYLRQPTRVE